MNFLRENEQTRKKKQKYYIQFIEIWSLINVGRKSNIVNLLPSNRSKPINHSTQIKIFFNILL